MKILYTVRKTSKKNFNNQESISSESLHMYLQLTNAHPDYKNQSVIINTDHIVAIYSETILKGSSGEFTVTCIHCPPHGTWNVLETIDQVSSLLANVVKSPFTVENTTSIKRTKNTGLDTIDFTV